MGKPRGRGEWQDTAAKWDYHAVATEEPQSVLLTYAQTGWRLVSAVAGQQTVYGFRASGFTLFFERPAE